MDKNIPTIKMIAKMACVDVSTVSRALNNSEKVKPETRERIKALARKLNYRPNEVARCLVGKKTNTVGVIVPELLNSFYAEIVSAIEQYFIDEGYSIILGTSDYNPEKEGKYTDLFIKKRVEGIILAAHCKPYSKKDIIKALSIPMVFIENYQNTGICSSVNVDNVYGAKLAVEHLKKLGHSRIGFIGDTVTNAERLEGYMLAMNEFFGGYNEDCICVDDVRFEEGGYSKMKKLLDRKPLPTAVFCVNDYFVIGAIKAVKESGLSVPDDISIVGFDDLRGITYTDIPATTIRQPKGELGKMAASILLETIKNPDNPVIKDIILKPELVVRKSTEILRK